MVENVNSDLYGVTVEIPVGTFTDNATITISEVADAPSFPENITGFGVPVDFSSDILFSGKITIKIPYTQEDLDKAGVSSIDDLKVYTYDTDTSFWVEVPIVNRNNNLFTCELKHFSIYRTGFVLQETPPSDGGGNL